MALFKCPECDNKVSDKASACPKCGCPIEIILSEIEKYKTDAFKTNKHLEGMNQNNRINKKYKGYNLAFDNNVYRELELRRFFAQQANDLSEQYKELYDEFIHSYDDMRRKCVYIAEEKIEAAYHRAIDYLRNKGIYDISVEMLINKNGGPISIERFIEPVLYRFDLIKESVQRANEKSEMRRNGGMHWIGGGFGISGAIKGAATASILNLGTGVLREIKNGTLNEIEQSRIKQTKDDMYKNNYYIDILVEGVRMATYSVVYVVGDELFKRGFLEQPLDGNNISRDRLRTIISNYDRNVLGGEGIKKIERELIQAITNNPYNVNIYIALQHINAYKKDNDLEELIEFFGIKEIYYGQAKIEIIQYLKHLNFNTREAPEGSTKKQLEAVNNIQSRIDYNQGSVASYFLTIKNDFQINESNMKARANVDDLVGQIRIKEKEIKAYTDNIYLTSGIDALWNEVEKGNGYAEHLIVEYYAEFGRIKKKEREEQEKLFQKGKRPPSYREFSNSVDNGLLSVDQRAKEGNEFAKYVALRTRGYAGICSQERADNLSMCMADRTNYATAKTSKGICYYRSKFGLKKDTTKAINLLKEAALKFNPRAIGMLGIIYRYDISTNFHEEIAKKLFNIAKGYNLGFVEEELSKNR